jgi:tetratricopeptide (TPR) repeat protein
MAKHWPLLVALLLMASARAQELPELSAIAFRAEPLSSEPRPAATAVTALEVARRSPSPGIEPNQRSAPRAATEDLSADIARRLAAFDAEEAHAGERSSTLIEPLQSLAALYEAAGNHDAAIAALQKAVWILRVNSGLFSLDQVDVVEALLAARRANGQHSEAATLEGYLQQLAMRNPEDARVASLLARLADAEMASARDLVDVPPPPQFSLTLNDFGPHPVELRSPALKAMLAARRHYAEAILTGTRNGSETFADLVALENRLIDTLYFELAHPKLTYYEDSSSRFTKLEALGNVGERMLQAKIYNAGKLTLSAVATAKAMIELGDWYLVFSANGAALAQYRAARDLLVADGVSQSRIDEILSPEIPPVLPAPWDTANRQHHGYVDAEIELGPYGTARNIDVLATSPDTPKILEKRLRQYLERNRFRPRFVDGRPARSDRFSARFYYDY